MPIRIPVKGVLVFRNGIQVRPTLGKPFDFTDEELKDLDRVAPGHVRKPIVEDDGSMVPAGKATAAAKPNKKVKAVTEASAAKTDSSSTGDL